MRRAPVSDADPHDRREDPRAPIQLYVEYDGAEDFLGDYTANLSSGGTFVLTARAFAPGTSVRLAFAFPGLRDPIVVDSTVRWSRGAPEPGVGVEFAAGASRDRLAALVARIRAADPSIVTRVVRVLVVEDNPHVAELLCDGLRAAGRRGVDGALAFVCVTASNGADALERLRTAAFDVAIIDLYLPVVGGDRVIDQARQTLGLSRLPIIAVSGGGESARTTALAAGADVFLDKPMRLRQVVDTMRALVQPAG
jgi:uncharacterized protein (TIGR02266 family)